MSERKYPAGTKFLSFFYAVETEGEKQFFVIRRTVVLPDGKRILPRAPRASYKNLKSEEEINAFVERLNHRDQRDAKIKKAIEIKTSFIPVIYIEGFREKLNADIPNQKDARYLYNCLHRFCLDFFVNKMKLPDPVAWKENETKWGLALLNELPADEREPLSLLEKDEKLSAKSIRHIIQVSNRFMEFLYQKNPRENALVKFKPITEARFKDHDARRKMEDDSHPGMFIKEKDWLDIIKKCPDELSPFINLMYHYGLRRAESLGCKVEDVRDGYLNVARKLKGLPRSGPDYGPLKDRDARKTEHWFASPEECYYWIEDGLTKLIHADTLGKKWDEFMTRMKLPYEIHDLRRTFVTRSLDKHSPLKVQLAVGHANISTTMKYVRDNRELEDRPFKPGSRRKKA